MHTFLRNCRRSWFAGRSFQLSERASSVIGHELAANPKVGMVSLTGSVSAGQQTMAAAAPNITKVIFGIRRKSSCNRDGRRRYRFGGKSIIASRVINTGQVCNCAERVYVDKKIKDAFIEKLVTGMKQVKSAIRTRSQIWIWDH